MKSFLFWNLMRQPLEREIAALASEHEIDFIALVECTIPPSRMLRALNPPKTVTYHHAPGRQDRITLYTKCPRQFVRPVSDSPRVRIRSIELPASKPFLLAIAHLPSKLDMRDPSQDFECVNLAREIREAEARADHRRTILVADLNMNPFESGVTGTEGLHAVMARDVAATGARAVQGRHYDFFYNPMWSLFGDIPTGPAGTCFFRRSEHVTFFWNMFDQVLIRPAFFPRS